MKPTLIHEFIYRELEPPRVNRTLRGLVVTLRQFNTGSISSVLGYNETCGRKRLWPITARLSKCTAEGGKR